MNIDTKLQVLKNLLTSGTRDAESLMRAYTISKSFSTQEYILWIEMHSWDFMVCSATYDNMYTIIQAIQALEQIKTRVNRTYSP